MDTQDKLANALRNLCAEMASAAKERGVSRDQVNTYRWCKRRIMAIVADHLTKTHPQPAQDAKDARVPCHCYDDTSRKLCMDKQHCWRAEAQSVMAKESGR